MHTVHQERETLGAESQGHRPTPASHPRAEAQVGRGVLVRDKGGTMCNTVPYLLPAKLERTAFYFK